MARRTAWCACLVSLALDACADGRCPRGQEMREERFRTTQALKERGCVDTDGKGNLRKQGMWESFYESGRKESEASFKDGNRHGPRTSWFENGQKKSEGTYSDGELEGLGTEWDSNGKIRFEAVYLHGNPEGLTTSWMRCNQDGYQAPYQADKQEGRSPGSGLDAGSTLPERAAGGLDKELILQVIHRNDQQIRFCYGSQLTRFPKLNGKIWVKFVISEKGAVAALQVVRSTVGSTELETCVASRVPTWQFPKPAGGGAVIVNYPFAFKQSAE